MSKVFMGNGGFIPPVTQVNLKLFQRGEGKQHKNVYFFFLVPCRAKSHLTSILYLPITRNALCLPPKFCINRNHYPVTNYCCEMLLGGRLGGNQSALWGIGK